MEAQDFEMPSPKRQRTDSPELSKANDTEMTGNDSSDIMLMKSPKQQDSAPDTDMLDLLMQHVEAEAGPGTTDTISKDTMSNRPVEARDSAGPAMTSQHITADQDAARIPEEPSQPPQIPQSNIEADLPPGLEASDPAVIAELKTIAESEDIPVTAETLLNDRLLDGTDATEQHDQQREWETDSSPYDSSDDSSDTSSDSDSDSEAGEDYALLDPLEQARILMAEDGGAGADSDDEGGSKITRNPGSSLRTQNEQAEAVPPKPDIIVTENMQIEELGNVEAIVENNVLIKGKTSGSYQVLESGSVLCLADRKVVGAIVETLGRVEEPLYTMRFASPEEIVESGVSEKGTRVFYVKDHSTFVFTQPLKAVKGSDASNLHDEEVGADEMEFSDDEAEAEYKRMMKAKRKGIDPGMPNDRARGSRGRGRGNRGTYQQNNARSDSNVNDSTDINYDDVEEGETDYTPLRRPDTHSQNQDYPPMSRSRNNQRGRGNRGRGRGGYQNSRQENQTTTQSMYNQSQGQYYPVQQPIQQPSYFGYSMPPPPPPQITPGGNFTGNSIPPSPMTPLPGSAANYNFNFAAAAQNQWQQYHQNQNTQFQQQFTGQINADAIAQVQRQLEQMQKQNGQNGWPSQ